jgi:putative membrane-bound dehydrogenase-like protein
MTFRYIFSCKSRLLCYLAAIITLVAACSHKRYADPLSPEEALKSFQLNEDFNIEIFAAEPFILDPVDLVFDEEGKAYVVEMPDYPYPPKEGKAAGRIRLLMDTNGDGRIDKSPVFADSLSEATSIFPWKGGLIVTAAPYIMYLKDTNGDFRADTREVLFSGFFNKNSEAQITSLRFGIDNWIYANNRGQDGLIDFSRKADTSHVSVRGADFRFRLDKDQFEPETGPGQFGQMLDRWGHRFFTENSIHIEQPVIPWRYLHRHPYLPSTTAGRQAHENVAIKSDQSVAYWGGDDITNGFIYKFIPTAPGNFSSGNLYVLETSAALGTGMWKQIANTTKAERNNTIALSTTAGAYNFQRIEDVEIGPDGKIYFASTATGRIYRFTDAGTSVSNLGVFVESTNYDTDGSGPFAPAKFEWPDNLAFDGEGNLWVLQDGGDNHIWVVSPAHTAAAPAIKVFANTPRGSEPTGITFSPDYKFMFISLQHPNPLNTIAQPDAAGNNIIFDTHTTLVIARKENLGAATLPVRYINMKLLQKNNGAEITWLSIGSNANSSFDIERSLDGINFTKIGSQNSAPTNNVFYTFFDNNLPAANNVYYRISQCNVAGPCVYSETRPLKINNINSSIKVYSLSTSNIIHVMYTSKNASDVLLHVYNNNGSEVYREKRKVTHGINNFNIGIENLPAGMYVLKINEGNKLEACAFIK